MLENTRNWKEGSGERTGKRKFFRPRAEPREARGREQREAI